MKCMNKLTHIVLVLSVMTISAIAGLNDGLILHYDFDTEEIGTMTDLSSNSNDGIICGATYRSNGMAGGAYVFDGIDDEIIITNNILLNPTNELSLSAWMNCAGEGTGNGIIVFKGSATRENQGQYALIYFPNNVQGVLGRAAFSLSAGAWHDHLSSEILNTNEWYHLVGTYRSGQLRFYINGELTYSSDGVSGYLGDKGGNLFIGSEHSFSSDEFFNGMIDDLRVYDRVLTTNEVTSLYEAFAYSNTAPVAALSASPTNGLPPFDVTLDFSTSYDLNDNITLCEIDADGDSVFEWQTNAPGQMITTYTESGIYTACVRVVDAGALTSMAYAVITVSTLNDGLLLHYGFDQDHASVTYDSSINDNDGEVSGATHISNGLCGGAFSFNGIDDEIVATNTPSLNPSNAVTVMAWMYCRGSGTGNGIIAFKGGLDRSEQGQYGLVYFPNDLQGVEGKASFAIGTTDNGWYDCLTQDPLLLDTWYHLAGTYTNGDLKLYIDGELTAEETHITGQLIPRAGNFYVGSEHAYPNDEYLNGMVDDVRVYDRVLSADEIREAIGTCGGNLAPRAALTATPSVGTVPLTVTLDFSASCDVNDSIVLCEVDQDCDGTYEYQTNAPGQIDVEYTSTGVYTAQVRVVDSYSVSDRALAVISVVDETQDLILHLPFDSDEGSTVTDQSTYGNDGEVFGATYSPNGRCGGAYWFDGIDDEIIITNALSLNPADELTITAWMRCLNGGTYNGILVFKGTPPRGGNGQYALIYFPNNLQGVQGRASFAMSTTGNPTWCDYLIEETLDLDTWHHLAGTYKSGTLHIYLDGLLAYTNGGVTGTIPDKGGNLYIGAEHSFPSNEFFKGLIDDVRIYSRALSATEIESLYTACPDTAPIAALTANPSEGTPPLSVVLDFSASYDPDDNLTLCEVDKEGDGIFEFSTPEPSELIVEYAEPGIYYPQVRVSDAEAQKATASATVTVWNIPAPTAILDASPVSGTAPLAVLLTGTNSVAATNRTIILYEFDTDGNGSYDNISTSGTITLTYRLPGTYDVALRVTDDLGIQDSDVQTITVTTAANPPEVILLTVPGKGEVPLMVDFTATATDDGMIVDYRWDFDGDDQIDAVTTSNTIQHMYTEPGLYVTSVTVTDNDGLSTKAISKILVCEGAQYKVWISKPKDGSTLWGEDISVIGHVAPAKDTVSVQFQYMIEGGSAWQDLNGVIYPQPKSYKTEWDVTSLIDGTNYNLRVIAMLGAATIVTSEVYTVTIDSAASKSVGSVVEDTVDGKRQKEETVSKDESVTVEVSDGTKVILDAETVPSNPTVQIILTGANTNPVNGAAYGLRNIDANRQISIETDLALLKPLKITMPYMDTNNDGIVDGTDIPETTLTIQYYDEEAGEWKRAISSNVHPDDNFVSADVYHLTEFGLFGNDNLLHPSKGGMLIHFTSQGSSATRASNISDGNKVSYWRSSSVPAPVQEFTYGFSNYMGAIASQVIFYNYGDEASGNYNFSRDFRVMMSMDGNIFDTVLEDTLSAQEGAQVFNFNTQTGRYVKMQISSGSNSQEWDLAEFSLHGLLTDDADADQMRDDWEMQHFAGFSRDGSGDFDDDLLTDAQEFAYGGDPTQKDTDHDGYSDWNESVAGTDLDDSNSLFQLRPEKPTPLPAADGMVITWESVVGKSYKIFGSTNLSSAWPTQHLYMVTGSGNELSYTNQITDVNHVIYRISVE